MAVVMIDPQSNSSTDYYPSYLKTHLPPIELATTRVPNRRDHAPYIERVHDLRRVRSVGCRTSLDFVAVDFGRVGGEKGRGRRRIGGYRRRGEQKGCGSIGQARNNAIEDTRQRFLTLAFDSGISQVEAPIAGQRVAAL